SGRIHEQIGLRENDEVGRIELEYQKFAETLLKLNTDITVARENVAEAKNKIDYERAEAAVTRLEKQRQKILGKITERDEHIAEARRRAEDDRQDVIKVGDELTGLYADPDELVRHARVVSYKEVEENEFNLNIARYVDTFEPEPRVEVTEALKELTHAETV